MAGTPRSTLRILTAAGSVIKKLTSLAASSVCSPRAAIDQYIDALLTIRGDSPDFWAGSLNNFISVPLAATNAAIWVWNCRWNAALFVANLLWSNAVVRSSDWLPAGGVAFIPTIFLARNAAIWVWNCRWNAALFVANLLWSNAVVRSSDWLPAGGVAFIPTIFLA